MVSGTRHHNHNVWLLVFLLIGAVASVPAGDSRESARDPSELTVRDWVDESCTTVSGIETGAIGVFNAAATTCPSSIEFEVTSDVIAPHFDSSRGLTELYISGPGDTVIRHDIDTELNHSEVSMDLGAGGPWIAEDLDLDGSVDLVLQSYETLTILSSPDWITRGSFTFPGMPVAMNPVLVNMDTDRFLEIVVTPHSFLTGRVVIIDYDSLMGSFVKLADVPAPFGAFGRPAAGDFDSDGRLEVFTGYDLGYTLFEWQDPHLVFIGHVGDTTAGNNFCAIGCRPKPGAMLHVLLGHSSGDYNLGFLYRLMAPVGDNEFELVHTFQEYTGFTGVHPCRAADTDCDGLDELVMCFYPLFKVWQWDQDAGVFISSCEWSSESEGTLSDWYAVDLDQNGAPEWAAVNHHEIFRAYPDPDCHDCDSSGTCPWGLGCMCACGADPECDSVVDVLDVVTCVDIAFRGHPVLTDPVYQCVLSPTDVTCDGVTNVLDVVHFVNVAFRSGDPVHEFCDPCAP